MLPVGCQHLQALRQPGDRGLASRCALVAEYVSSHRRFRRRLGDVPGEVRPRRRQFPGLSRHSVSHFPSRRRHDGVAARSLGATQPRWATPTDVGSVAPPLGRVAEWQTRWLQVPVRETSWGFKSPLAHSEIPVQRGFLGAWTGRLLPGSGTCSTSRPTRSPGSEWRSTKRARSSSWSRSSVGKTSSSSLTTAHRVDHDAEATNIERNESRLSPRWPPAERVGDGVSYEVVVESPTIWCLNRSRVGACH